jgi:hypothetical protein
MPMTPPRFLLKFSVLALLRAATALRAAPIQHDFLALDEGLVQLLHVNERDPSKNWIVHVDHLTPRDLQLVGGGRVLVGHDAGYTEYDLATGKVLKDVGAFKGVTSARRLPNGHTLLAGVNLDGSTGVVVIEIDDTNAVVKKLVYPGDYVRLIRETAQGTFLLMTNTMIREGDREGKIIHEFPVDGFKHAWKALRLPNGHIVASAGYGAFMVELDASGAVVRKWGAKGQTPPEVNTNFYATFQLLPNGDIVVANWQGHGKTHGDSGRQLIEFNPAGDAIVWTWSDAKIISTLQGVLILDGLDPSVLHDEREGLMKPLKK